MLQHFSGAAAAAINTSLTLGNEGNQSMVSQ